MLVRTITALVLLPVVFLLLIIPQWAIALIVGAGSFAAVLELLNHWKRPVNMTVKLLACFVTCGIFTLVYFDAPAYMYLGGFSLFVVLLFLESMRRFGVFLFEDLCVVLFSALTLPLMYSSLLRIAKMEDYKYIILLPFLLTIISDVFAMLSGKLFGKHKITPVISPHKTVEGSIGSFLFCLGCTLLYGWILTSCFNASVDYLRLALYGVFGNVFSQLGDLSFSVIKRQFSIKDFGRIIPGHGGILDRFDSLLLVAPLTELLLLLLPAITVL